MTQRSQKRTRSDFLEIEATLVIWSKTPQVLVSQIARLTSVANYRLLPQESETIHDVYLDTPARALEAQKLGLRIREVDRACLITLKGDSRPADWGGVERLEIEAAWSKRALTRVLKALMDRGIEMPRPGQDFDALSPLDVMASLGLEIVQDRRDDRKVRHVVPRDKQGGPVLAELAIDSVTYRFGGREIRLHEVEIEAKIKDGSSVLKDVVEGLIAMYGPALRRWDHGKLVTGKAIEQLLGAGALEGLLDTEGNLKPAAYDRIDGYLRHGNI